MLMAAIDISVRIGGEAGQGVESSGAGFVQALAFAGLRVIGVADYYSRIRGGHNFFTVRVSDEPVYAARDTIQLLIALDAETIKRHVGHLAPQGIIIVDEGVDFDHDLLQGHDVQLVQAPLARIAEENGSAVMANTAAIGVACALLDFDLGPVFAVIAKNFKAKSGKIVEQNTAVAQQSFDWARDHAGVSSPWALRAQETAPQVAISANQAFAIGSITAGCKFVAGYPMTPATSVLEYMAGHAADWGLVVKHAEDEIAAMNMVIGAGHAGVRALVPTSGGGFDLMTEGLSLAGMTETPIVVFLAQRPGPATGLATRTAQSDLFLAINAGHGEFPRAVLAPHTPEEAFDCAIRAFNIAEKYQCQVLVLSDQYLSSTEWTRDMDLFDFDAVVIDRGKLVSAEELEAMDEYNRYAITPDGVSPRAIPGTGPKSVYLTTSDEHLENGHITEDPEVTTAMQSKRLRKAEGIRTEMRPPLSYGPNDAETTFVSWGSSYGPVRETVDILNAGGTSANMVHFVDLWPFPAEEARQALGSAKKIVDVEGNAQAQFAFLLSAHAGIQVHERVLKYDGRPFTPDYILGRLEGK
jgi:2-oxoglutarate ferredoxin oxidoreductase subunit alpha